MKRAGLLIAGLGCLALAWAWGAFSANHDLFPYRQLRRFEALHRGLLAVEQTVAGPPLRSGGFRRLPDGLVVERFGDLRTLGYLGGTTPADGDSGVTVVDRERVAPGYNLAHDGHAPEAVLFDGDGRPLHRWRLRYADAFPGSELAEAESAGHWRRVRLAPDGALFAIFEGLALVKVDRDSRLLWGLENGAHHELDETPDGRVLVLTRSWETVAWIDPDRPIFHDHLDVLGAEGTPLRRVSMIEAIHRSRWSPLLRGTRGDGDPLHTNAVEILDGRLEPRIPAFRAGNVLVSFPRIDTIGVIDLERGELVWALSGAFRLQHDPDVLANGNLLVFDNCGGSSSRPPCARPSAGLSRPQTAGRSRVLEIDPVTQELVWSHSPDELFTHFNGAAHRLANGNTLVVESDRGHAYEVTADGTIVWDYRTPHRAEHDARMIATLFDLVRVEASEVAWLGER